MKTKILIVEDEILVAENTADDLKREGFEITEIALSSKEALISIEKSPPHIILMDINIKGDIDGIELTEEIQKNYSMPVIYVSSNVTSQYINRAIATSPSAFISKPYQTKDLVIAIELAVRKHNEAVLTGNPPLRDSVFVKSGEYHRKVFLDEILYIEANGSYCTVFTEKKRFVLSFNLFHFEQEIKTDTLLRVHRSFIVNINKVDAFDKNTLRIGTNVIPVSNSFKEKVSNSFRKL